MIQSAVRRPIVLLTKILEWAPVLRTRQHHAIEHATIHLLSQRNPQLRLVGRSDGGGFYLYGDLDTEQLYRAVESALSRLQQGESELAIHPHCGTNLVAAGTLTGLAAFVATLGAKRPVWDRIPAAMLATTVALLAAQPLGYVLQERITTSPDVLKVRLRKISRQHMGRLTVHRVEFDSM
jgi:hypothetical protein